MRIVYQYYSQGTSQMVSFAANAATSSSTFNTTALNHISVVSNVAAFLFVTQSGSLVSASSSGAGMGQYILANSETIIPCVKATGCSIFAVSAGSAWITEFLAK
jgi:hypothetical protein